MPRSEHIHCYYFDMNWTLEYNKAHTYLYTFDTRMKRNMKEGFTLMSYCLLGSKNNLFYKSEIIMQMFYCVGLIYYLLMLKL